MLKRLMILLPVLFFSFKVPVTIAQTVPTNIFSQTAQPRMPKPIEPPRPVPTYITQLDQTPKAADIRKLLQLTKTSELISQTVTRLIKTLKESVTDVPPAFWDSALRDVNEQDLMNRIIPIYDKYYSDDDLKQLISFYQSPIGQKVIQTMPQVTQASMAVGEQWGEELAKRVQKELDEERAGNPQPTQK